MGNSGNNYCCSDREISLKTFHKTSGIAKETSIDHFNNEVKVGLKEEKEFNLSDQKLIYTENEFSEPKLGTTKVVSTSATGRGSFSTRRSGGHQYYTRVISSQIEAKELIAVTEENRVSQIAKKNYLLFGSSDSPSSLPGICDLYDPSKLVEGPFRHLTSSFTYTGQMKDGVPQGWGKIICKKGTIIEGWYEKGKLSRYARIFDNDNTCYIGGFEDTFKHGYGKYLDKQGTVIEGKWEKGRIEGICKMIDSEGGLVFKGKISNGLREGQGIFVDKVKHYQYTGFFKNDLYEGQGQKKYENGKEYKGDFHQGLEHGQGILFFIDGRSYKGKFEKGEPHGEGILTKNNGDEVTVRYIRGERYD